MTHHLTRGLAVAAIALTVLAPSAGAATPAPLTPAAPYRAAGTTGTIVFIKDRDVWIARGDGSGARRLTRDGTGKRPYRSPSEADDGIIAAARGTEIVRMNQAGKVLNRIDPPRLTNSAGQPMDGTVNEVAISPDGKRIAYSYVRYSCVDGGDCLVRYVTGYTLATKLKKAGRPTYFHDAAWVGDHRTLQTGGYGSQVMVHDTDMAPVHWFDDSDYAGVGFDTDLADGDLSPDGGWLAEIRGFGDTSAVAWFQVTGDATSGPPPTYPEIVCLTGGEPKHASPTWSPDSTALAWAAKDGIWVQRAAAATDCGGDVDAELAIKGGSAPDWSSAPLRKTRARTVQALRESVLP